jgi:large subunit ribosomal protein L17
VRHSVYGRKLQRSKNERTALFKSLVRELILHESITTTAPKAKAIKGLVDTLISKSQKNTNASNASVESFVNQPEVRKKLTETILPKLKGRSSGFTTSVRLGARLGDGAMMVRMSFVESAKKAEAKSKDDVVVESSEQETVNEVAPEKPKRAPRSKK